MQFNKMVAVRGNVKIHGLQPPYSAASCSQLKCSKSYTRLLNAAAIWLQAVMSSDASPYVLML